VAQVSPSPTPRGLQVLYLDRTTVYLTDGGGARGIARLPSANVFASQGSPWIAYLVPGAPSGGDEDFVPRPRLRLWDPRSGGNYPAGPAVDALWNADGTRLAFLRPSAGYRCDAETCTGGLSLRVLKAPSADSTPLLPRGPWTLLAWSGDRALVADRRDPAHTLSVGPGGDTLRLEVPPSQMWDASPDGRRLVIARPGQVRVVPLTEGKPDGDGAELDLGRGYVLADGAFSHDGSRVAAVALDPRSPRRSHLVVFSALRPEPRVLPGSSGAAADVLWSEDDSRVVAAAQTRPGRLEALACPADGGARCRPLFGWKRGVTLLRASQAP
jgi:hypothetical protein